MFEFHSYWSKGWKLSKRKSLEIQLMRDSTLICFEIDLTHKGQSHAGPMFSIALFFHRLTIMLPDSRHWNYEADRWETQEEQEEWAIEIPPFGVEALNIIRRSTSECAEEKDIPNATK